MKMRNGFNMNISFFCVKLKLPRQNLRSRLNRWLCHSLTITRFPDWHGNQVWCATCRHFRSLRHLINFMRRHGLTNKKTDNDNDKYILITPSRAILHNYIWLLRNWIRMIRRHDMTNNKTDMRTNTNTKHLWPLRYLMKVERGDITRPTKRQSIQRQHTDLWTHFRHLRPGFRTIIVSQWQWPHPQHHPIPILK